MLLRAILKRRPRSHYRGGASGTAQPVSACSPVEVDLWYLPACPIWTRPHKLQFLPDRAHRCRAGFRDRRRRAVGPCRVRFQQCRNDVIFLLFTGVVAGLAALTLATAAQNASGLPLPPGQIVSGPFAGSGGIVVPTITNGANANTFLNIGPPTEPFTPTGPALVVQTSAPPSMCEPLPPAVSPTKPVALSPAQTRCAG